MQGETQGETGPFTSRGAVTAHVERPERSFLQRWEGVKEESARPLTAGSPWGRQVHSAPGAALAGC